MEHAGVAAGTKKEIYGRRAIRIANGFVDTAVLLLVLLLIVFGSFAVWDTKQVHDAASATKYEIYKPTDENGGLTFQELQEINKDVFAWLTVYGTHIDYPVVQGKDNMRYVNTNAEGRYSLSGAIFLDKGSSRDFSDFSSILYGHHMEKQAMFGEIGLFADRGYFTERKYGMLYFSGKEHGLEFFAFVHTDAYNTAVFRTKIEGQGEQQAYLDMLLDMAIHVRELNVTTDDRIVLLSTCSASSTNGRDILIGRITDELYDDPFWVPEEERERTYMTINGPSGLWGWPFWAGLLLITVLLIAIVLLASYLVKARKRGRQSDEKKEHMPARSRRQ